MRPRLELADVVRRWGNSFLVSRGNKLNAQQRRVLRDVVCCRTAQLGGHVHQCNRCEYRKIAYNSCRNRHCPKCQAAARAKWTERREAELLPVPYFHVVFTLPHQLNLLALSNPQVVYSLLFRAAWETLRDVAANPDRLGAKIGTLMVLHTWGQNLSLHPHVHCVVPGGALSTDGKRWVPCRTSRQGKPFFLPVRVLSRVFQGKFIAMLKRANRKGELRLVGSLSALKDAASFGDLLNAAVAKDWIVYAKRPFGGPPQVLKYLARYTYRVAISNHRLQSIDDRGVTFHYRDYADGGQGKTMSLGGEEFLRRFLLHTLPRGFTRIRHYGILANRNRTDRLQHCRQLLGAEHPPIPTGEPSATVNSNDASSSDEPQHEVCPVCQTGSLFVSELSATDSTDPCVPPPHFQTPRLQPARLDSS